MAGKPIGDVPLDLLGSLSGGLDALGKESDLERRLAAILAANVVGYSRLMGDDEELTLATLKGCRDVIDNLIARHHGRVFGTAGDSVIAEFASPVEAVRCAVAVQQGVEAHNADLADDKRMQFRIGINLGDVMAEGDNLLGDGVNIAARLEALAEPGGITISGAIHDHLSTLDRAGFADTGEQTLKNIAKPIRVWSWTDGNTTSDPDAPLPLPDKPSLAVLPFTNMSGDPQQEYFSDGITEDIITELSRYRELFVIARNSSFSYKGKSPKVQDVGRELGVGYVVEGSVRKAGNRIRISAQLVEAETGNHIWAERFDRDLEDIFAVQDEVTQAIVAVRPVRLHGAALERAQRKPIENLTAYEHFLHARWRWNRRPGDIAPAIYMRGFVLNYCGDPEAAVAWFDKALRLDPQASHHDLEAYIECHYKRRAYQDAIDAFNQWQDAPFYMYDVLAACHAQLGNMDQAAVACAAYMDGQPDNHDVGVSVAAHLRMCRRQEDKDHWLEGYRKAGLDV